MRNILNLIITLAVFWVGNEYFSEYINFTDTKTLIIAGILMFVMNFIFAGIALLSFLLIPLGIGCVTTIAVFFIAIFFIPIKLWLLDTYVPGVEFNGFWTYAILTVILFMFSIQLKARQEKQ